MKNAKRTYRFIPYIKETLFAMGAAVFWGVAYFIINTVVGKEPWQVVLATISLTMAVVSVLLIGFSSPKTAIEKIKKIPRNRVGVVSGVALTLGSILLYIAAHRSGSILIPAVIGSAAPLMTSLLAAVVDKEKINVFKRLGAVVVVAGIILLNVA